MAEMPVRYSARLTVLRRERLGDYLLHAAGQQ